MTATWLGATVEKEVTFRNTSGVLTDPSSVTATVKKPDASTAAGTVNNTAVGEYDVLFASDPGDDPGIWFYRIVGTGNDVDAIVEGSFCMKASSVV